MIWINKKTVQGTDPEYEEIFYSQQPTHDNWAFVVPASWGIISTHKEVIKMKRFPGWNSDRGNDMAKGYPCHAYPGYILVTYVYDKLM